MLGWSGTTAGHTVFHHTLNPQEVSVFLSPTLGLASLVEDKTLPALFNSHTLEITQMWQNG